MPVRGGREGEPILRALLGSLALPLPPTTDLTTPSPHQPCPLAFGDRALGWLFSGPLFSLSQSFLPSAEEEEVKEEMVVVEEEDEDEEEEEEPAAPRDITR